MWQPSSAKISMDRSDLTALVVAGGMSSRFGRDKATHIRDGRTLVDAQVELATAIASHVVVGLPPPADGEPVGWTALREQYEIVHDQPQGCGPIGSLNAGLQITNTPWLLVLACDLVAVSTEDVANLSGKATDQVDVVAAVGASGRPEPLLAIYSVATLPVVQNQLNNSEYALWRLLSRLRVHTVPFPEAALRNVNRPGDISDST